MTPIARAQKAAAKVHRNLREARWWTPRAEHRARVSARSAARAARRRLDAALVAEGVDDESTAAIAREVSRRPCGCADCLAGVTQ